MSLVDRIDAYFPDAVDAKAQAQRSGIIFTATAIRNAQQEAISRGQTSCTVAGTFYQGAIDRLTAKGYQINHDGVSYSLNWADA